MILLTSCLGEWVEERARLQVWRFGIDAGLRTDNELEERTEEMMKSAEATLKP